MCASAPAERRPRCRVPGLVRPPQSRAPAECGPAVVAATPASAAAGGGARPEHSQLMADDVRLWALCAPVKPK